MRLHTGLQHNDSHYLSFCFSNRLHLHVPIFYQFATAQQCQMPFRSQQCFSSSFMIFLKCLLAEMDGNETSKNRCKIRTLAKFMLEISQRITCSCRNNLYKVSLFSISIQLEVCEYEYINDLF